ncbi:MAG: hypothetical protein LBR28_01975 [Bacteroidales bacterium]|jgi:predicted histone-like DNA-binding protein|nr:hypothetical protein [Bacteroidales bacterium]
MQKFNFPFVAVQKKQNVGSFPGIKFRKQQLRGQTISVDMVAQLIQDKASVTRGDVYAVLATLADVVKENVAIGNSISLGFLGKLTPYLSSKNKDSLEEAIKQNPEDKIQIRFKQSPELKEFFKTRVAIVKKDLEISGLQP